MNAPVTAAPLARQLARFGPVVAPFVEHYVQTWTSYKPAWNYEDGCVWKGCLDLADASGLRFLHDFVYAEVSARIGADGSIRGFEPDEFNIDNVNAGKVVATLFAHTGETRFRDALDAQMAQLARHPRTRSGNFWHKKIYPHQVWLDGLYMAQPLRCTSARMDGDAEAIADVVRQFEFVQTTLRDAATGLLYHGWDESRAERWSNPGTGCSPNFWARAMGWYAMALVDGIDALRAGHVDATADAASARLATILVDVATALMRVRSRGGLWYQVLDRPAEAGNYEEASASLMIAYALMKGARLGVLAHDASNAGRQALATSIARFLDERALHGICGVAGLGNVPYRDGSIAYYLSEPVVANDPKGVAALFMALAEALR
jgi:unsaturated rhamnogalacturonyl hydrolase